MPLQQTSGNDTQDAYGGGKAVVPVYVENVFSTYLYQGNSSNQPITNGIDLAGKGGLVWCKDRTSASSHSLTDTVRGGGNNLSSNTTAAQDSYSDVVSFNNNGFNLSYFDGLANTYPDNFASWTFRKQPKFFDIVTYTGTGTNRTIAHSLGSTPGCIIVKDTSASTNWAVWHTGANNAWFRLNTTSAQDTANAPYIFGNDTTVVQPTSTNFTVGSDPTSNNSGDTYVAYIFASNAGGFGLTGTDNVISCGSWTGTGSLQTINLGWEPQWILIKRTNASNDWQIYDNMRGWSQTSFNGLYPDSNSAEVASGNANNFYPVATGFVDNGLVPSGSNYIYIAIRRGPMAVPTDPTTVFAPITRTGTNSAATITGASFPPDLFLGTSRTNVANTAIDRLRGRAVTLLTSSANNETTSTATQDCTSFNMNGVSVGTVNNTTFNDSGEAAINWLFGRAPGFFDIVCYKGTGSAATQAHNLGVVPQLIIVKNRKFGGTYWGVYSATLGPTQYLWLNLNNAQQSTYNYWNNTSPTSTVFSLSSTGEYVTNASGQNYVAYLFATLTGVSYVGSYTGTGATQTISCGFTGGARFVLIKRTDSTGDWWVWDTARGMVAGTDPRLALDLTSAETNANWVYTTTGGFQIVTTDASVNAYGGSYIFLAIA